MKTASLLLIIAGACLAILPTRQLQAAIFVGSWEVDDGPNWGTNPPVYSGQEAAALLFHGSPNDYIISTVDNNPAHIDHMAWYSVYGLSGGTMLAENYHFDIPPIGYNFGDFATISHSDASAYVDDNAMGSFYTNYAFRVDDTAPAVPEPASLAIWSLGAFGCAIASYRRRRAV